MPFRMIDYRLRVYRRYPQKQMKQVGIYQEILREGEIKGKLEGKLEVALNLLKNKMSIQQVVTLTGLSENLIRELAQSLTE